MGLLKKNLEVIEFWCLRWHLRLNLKNTKSMGVSRSRTDAPGYGILTLGGTELEEVKSLRILGVTLDSKLTFEAHLREVVLKAARSVEHKSYLIVLVCPRAVSMHMSCPSWSIEPCVDIVCGISFEFA